MIEQRTGLLEKSALISLIDSSISWAQLERGSLDIGYRVVGVSPFVISSRRVNLAIQVEGSLANGRRAIVNIDSRLPGARWFGQDVGSDSIALCNEELDIRTTGPSTVLALAVDENAMQSGFSDSLDALDLFQSLRRKGVSQNPVFAGRLRNAIYSVCSVGGAPPARLVAGTLIPLLAATLSEFNVHAVERSDSVRRRFSAVRACERYMREHLDTSLTILDLSRVAQMRSRTLINAFEAITGLSPMDYLKRLRLSAVHRVLKASHKSNTRIIDVAMEWGFWHMGHFSRDYRALFGESPSQTLLGHR